MADLAYAVRGSFGYSLKCGAEQPREISGKRLDPKHDLCRSMKFSNTGAYLCFCDSTRTVVIDTSTGEEILAADLGKTQQIAFSPKDNIMVTWEPYVIYGSRMNEDGSMKKPNPNLRFWSITERKLLCTTIATKQSAWLPHFSEDESMMLRQNGSELQIYENSQFERFSRKIVIKDLESIALAPGPNPHALCFIPPTKGQPALIHLRTLGENSENIFTKTSFNCDKCSMMWNSRGTAALVTATVDVDKSNQSYYGVSHLHCISTKRECFQVPLSKNGPLHAVEWSPSSKEFCVCFGFMPSRVAVFNLKGDIIWDLGEGHRNEIHYNPFGNILAICGFGNISSGKMSFWNVKEQKEIVSFEVPHTNHFEWAPDGQHYSTATTAPRLRISNGYRIWHYTGKKLHEQSHDKEELWQVSWRPSSSYNKFDAVELSPAQKAAISNLIITSNVPKAPTDKLQAIGAITKQGIYVPPRQRQSGSNKGALQTHPLVPKPVISEAEKKIKQLQKKLEDISKLKQKQDSGAALELNQLEKIKSEDKLLSELKQLTLDQ